MTHRSDLRLAAEALCEAVEFHADLYTHANPDPQQTIAAELRIAELASNYRDLVQHRTGTYLAFGRRAVDGTKDVTTATESAVTEHGDAGNSSEISPALAQEVFLVDKYFLQSYAPAELLEFAHSRLGYPAPGAQEAARLLCEKDGWKPEKYPEKIIRIIRHEVRLCIGY